jgi:hypothetical protein
MFTVRPRCESLLPDHSLLSSSAPGAGGCQGETVYKHTDEEPVDGYYTPRSPPVRLLIVIPLRPT